MVQRQTNTIYLHDKNISKHLLISQEVVLTAG